VIQDDGEEDGDAATALCEKWPSRADRHDGADDVCGCLSHRPRARDAPAPAGQPTTPADPVARLRELVDLRKQGFLTEEEFAAQKALVLGQPQVLPAEPGRAPGGTGDQ
jgi:hypothetical protein